MSRFRSFDFGGTKAYDGSSLRVRGRSPTRQHRPTTAGVIPHSTYKSEPNIRSEKPMSASEAGQYRLSSRSAEHHKPEWGGSSVSSVSARPSSVASSRRSSLASSSGRKRSAQMFKKREDFVDETLFGVNHNSAEEQHKALHNLLNTEPFCRMPDPVVACPPKRTRARPSTRPDLKAVIDLPRAPKASAGQRFQKTTTLQGGYEQERHAKTGGPSRANHSNLLQHKPHRAQRTPAAEQKTTVRSPFVHENTTVSQPAPKYRPTTSLWENHPNV